VKIRLPKLRKVNTKRRKALRKELNKYLADQAEAFMNHPKECCVCAEPFERTAETTKTWQVVVKEDKILLSCPACTLRAQTAAQEKVINENTPSTDV
jgi:hypothetical protein